MSRSIIKLTATVLVIAALLFVALYGIDFADSFRIPGILDSEETTGVKSIVQGLDLKGGSVIVFEAATENPTDQQMDTVASMMTTRLGGLGLTEAVVTRQGDNKVRIEIPSEKDPMAAAQTLGAVAQLQFMDASGNVVLEGSDIKTASAKYGQTSQLGGSENYVELKLNSSGIQKFSSATAAAASAPEGQNFIAIVMDGEILSMPRVETQITEETCIISGNFTAESASALAANIRSGQLPFTLNQVELRSVSATLGENALKTSLTAGMIGILLVMLFMLLFYRLPGLLACVALTAYMSIVGIVLANLNVNLTLPGIAGIILSVGMAVDANVVIFERIKEELRIGKTARTAVDSGFKRAFAAIIDSNITTLIAAVILWRFGTGSIAGFGQTLFIGVVVSMFTAIFLTKFLLRQTIGMNIKNLWLYGINTKKTKEGANNA